MKYSCKLCNYETDDKSNFNKHLKSVAHSRSRDVAGSNQDVADIYQAPSDQNEDHNNIKYQCYCCGIIFQHHSSLSRHVNSRCKEKKDKDLASQLNQLKSKLQEYKKQNDEIKKENNKIKKHLYKPNNNTIINNQTVNISNYNHIQEYYTTAPPLRALDDYELLDNYDEDPHSTLIDKLIHYKRQKLLATFLGDFIIKII